MGWVKKISKHPGVIRGAGALLAAYVWFVFKTSRWENRNKTAQVYWKQKTPFIVCFWHNRLMMQMCFWNRQMPCYMLNSSHRDGQICGEAVSYFGINNISGSTSKRGTEAMRSLLSILKKGGCVGITPDGPRGPRFVVSPGLIHIAWLSGVDIVPCISSTTRRKVLSSWDRFIVALPFSRGVLLVGDPIKPPASKEEFEAVRQRVEKKLQELADQADVLCGHAPLR